MADTHNEPSWVRLRSITQEKALDEFLSTAELAGTEFTAGSTSPRTALILEQNGKTSKLSPRTRQLILIF